MILSSKEFWYNGHSSKEFEIENITIDKDVLEEPFLGSRTINEEKIKWNPTPYFYNAQESCKMLNLSFAISNYNSNTTVMNKTVLRRLAIWLSDLKQYHDLWFLEDCYKDEDGNYDITNPRRIYRAMLSGDSTINHFGLPEGWIDLTFKCDSPYCYSPILGGHIYNCDERANDGDGSVVYFGNYADMIIKPQIKIIVGQKDPDDETDDPHNQSIKIIGEKIEENQLPPVTIDGFQRDYPYTPTDYTKFPVFEFSGGKKATGFFQLLDTVFYGEKFYLGEKVYEFDLGMGKPYNKYELNNILVPIEDGIKAHNTLRFNEDSNITDGSTVTIGDQTFEYDWNDIVAATSIKVDVSNYVANAKGILHLNSNLLPNQEFSVGDITYTMIGGTNEFVVKMTDHMLTDGSELNYIVRNNVKTLTQSNVNINTNTVYDIFNCLLRNVTKNPSDLGIRKMKYLDKDFVMCLWDGESEQDYQQEIDGVPINGRIIIAFDEPVNESTVNGNTIQVRDVEGNELPVVFDISTDDGGKIIGVTPTSNYSYDEDYYLYVSKGVKDVSGNSFKQIRKIKFHTKSESDTTEEVYDNVSVVKVFNFYNSKKIDKSTLTDSNIYVVEEGNSTHIDVNMKLINNGNTISVYPKTKYDNNTTYKLHIKTNVEDINGDAILATEKIITFTTEDVLNETIIDNDFIPITNFAIDKSVKIAFDDKLNESYINTGTVKLFDVNNNEISVYLEISSQYPNILIITPVSNLEYNSIYYLYITGAVQYVSGINISEPRQYKIITMTEEEATNTSTSSDDNNELTVTEQDDINLQHIDLETPVNTDKCITYNFNINLDEGTINTDNIYVLDSKGNRTSITVQSSLDSSGIRIFPNMVWAKNETYNVYVTNDLTMSEKPRVFAGDIPADEAGNLGDYANAVNIFQPLGLEIIKTNGFKVQGTNLLDQNGDIVKFKKYDIVFQNDYGLNSSDFNSDGTIKDGTEIISVPTKGIYTADAKNYAGANRVETKNKMEEYADRIKGQSWINKQLFLEDTNILTFSTKSSNERISISIDNTIILNNDLLLVNEIPKKIVNQTANDDIYLYNISEKDFCVDRNMLVPYEVQGAKAYAGRAFDGLDDDYTNAIAILGVTKQ